MITDLKTGKKYNTLYEYYTDWKNCPDIESAFTRLQILRATDKELKKKDNFKNEEGEFS